MKARLVVLSVVSVLAILLLGSPAPAGESAGLKAGTAKIDITPQKPVTMSGYASRKDLSTGVHDPLSARVVAFEAAANGWCWWPRTSSVSTMARPTTCGRRFWPSSICSLRSCSWRPFTPMRPPRPALTRERNHANNIEYTEALKGKYIEVIRKALSNMEPVKLGLGVGLLSRRRQPSGAARHQQGRELHRTGTKSLRPHGQRSARDEDRQGGR